MIRRAAVALTVLFLLAGCGGAGGAEGTATLWVTRDRGAHVVFAGSVPAGLDAIQVVERKLKVTTRYGGRYVQSIAGIQGSLGAQRDWFYFVDGIEGSRSAAEVTVHAGDNVWWDFRHWTPATEELPVVAGAYPHPFVDGATRVLGDASLARPIAHQVHGTTAPGTTRNLIVVGGAAQPGTVRIGPFRHGYRLELGVDVARRLARDPAALRYRF